jgi:thioredoxin reductase (NADPH)
MAQIKEIKGDKFVTSLLYLDRNKKEEKELKVQGVFIRIGSITSVDFAKDFLKLNKNNEIVINPKTNQTSIKEFLLPEMLLMSNGNR